MKTTLEAVEPLSGIPAVEVGDSSSDTSAYRGSAAVGQAGKLTGKVALITGDEDGIGRTVCVAFAREGADIAIVCFEKRTVAERTAELVRKLGRRCLVVVGDIGCEEECRKVVQEVIRENGRLDILVNNAAQEYVSEEDGSCSAEGALRIFSARVFAHCFLCKAALPYLRRGTSIINTTSTAEYVRKSDFFNNAAAKPRLASFTTSLALSLASRGIRANAVARRPVVGEEGEPIRSEAMEEHSDVLSEEIQSYVFLASNESADVTGQVLYPGTASWERD